MMLNFPPRILPGHRAACAEVIAELQAQEGGLLAAVIGGSVGSGKATERSDLDLFILHRGNWYQRRFYLASGIHVDLFIDCENHLADQIRPGGNNVIIHNYATGWVLWDPFAKVAAWQKRARSVLAAPRSLRDGEEFFHTCRVHNCLSDVLKSDPEDAPKSAYLLHQFIHSCIEATYAKHRRWKTTTKNILAEIATFDERSARLIAELLMCRGHEPNLHAAARALAGRCVMATDVQRLHGPVWELHKKAAVIKVGGQSVVVQKPG